MTSTALREADYKRLGDIFKMIIQTNPIGSYDNYEEFYSPLSH